MAGGAATTFECTEGTFEEMLLPRSSGFGCTPQRIELARSDSGTLTIEHAVDGERLGYEERSAEWLLRRTTLEHGAGPDGESLVIEGRDGRTGEIRGFMISSAAVPRNPYCLCALAVALLEVATAPSPW